MPVRPGSVHSNSTQWQRAGNGFNEEDEWGPQRHQHRIRHLATIQIRNLTLNPMRDQVSSALLATPPTSSRTLFASDDTDLHLRTRRKRAGSNAAVNSRIMPLEWHERERERAEVVAFEHSSTLGSSDMERSRSNGSSKSNRRASNGILRPEQGIEEGTEPASSSSYSDVTRSTPSETTSPSSNHHATLPFVSMRQRSSSRASIVSVASNQSGSTIRPSSSTRFNRQDTSDSTAATVQEDFFGRASYNSESVARKEKQRRIATMKRRLVDSFITLSTVPSISSTSAISPSTSLMEGSRNRVTSNPGERPRLSMNRSSSFTGKKRSSTSVPTVSSSNRAATPFYTSSPELGTMYPTFNIDSTHFLVDDLVHWQGQQEERMMVEVWTRSAGLGKCDGKGKGKAEPGEEVWRLLSRSEVEFDQLISLGKDPLSFPPLPPNSLVFNFEDEYFTASLLFPSSPAAESDADDAGNQSDPGSTSQVLSVIKRKGSKQKGRALSTDESKRTIESESVEQIVEFASLYAELREIRTSSSETRQRLDGVYADEDEYEYLNREKNQLEHRVTSLSETRDILRLAHVSANLEIDSRRIALRARRGRLKAAYELESQNAIELSRSEDGIVADEIICSNLRQTSIARRTTLITSLAHIFPIEPSLDSPSMLLFTILGQSLPNSSYPPSASDDTLSSALGYVAQVVDTLAIYLSVPLYYPLNLMGSRSTILDLISAMSGPRAFPLYGRGVEQYRFDYGVFLLNKNIEQLMMSQNIITLDLRNTLPNLKTLILSLSYDPSNSSFEPATFCAPLMEDALSSESFASPPTTPKPLSFRSISPSPTITRHNSIGGIEKDIVAGDKVVLKTPLFRNGTGSRAAVV